MNRRIIAAVVAALLALAGGVLTYSYAAGADSRAMADLEPTVVLTVVETVPEGTPADGLTLEEDVVSTEVPAGAVVPGAVGDLADLEGLVATADLLPGEQVVAERFVAPEDLDGSVEVPQGFHTLSLQLTTERVVGGAVQPGDTVGVFVSMESEGDGEEDGGDSSSSTHLVFHKVLVTDVRGGIQQQRTEDGEETETAPEKAIMVTVALSPPDAEKFVFAAEYADIWLSLEPEEAKEGATRIVDPEVIFE
ncbi:Flp pilus assembly protein CpaB [Isoptericola sediminis]|uniref:Flp pilus assembly protein CpaB n=1 Tax=Isoptericola sediminis TaxID=2733572 RepID=A0A849K387_9MICO|nr:Flp pilus assembly protein CpaB [Isoptericola sediminis]